MALRAGARDGLAGQVVHHLSVDLLVRAEYRQARTLGGSADFATDARLDARMRVLSFLLATDMANADYLAADLPALRRMYSSVKRTPLPL